MCTWCIQQFNINKCQFLKNIIVKIKLKARVGYLFIDQGIFFFNFEKYVQSKREGGVQLFETIQVKRVTPKYFTICKIYKYV